MGEEFLRFLDWLREKRGVDFECLGIEQNKVGMWGDRLEDGKFGMRRGNVVWHCKLLGIWPPGRLPGLPEDEARKIEHWFKRKYPDCQDSIVPNPLVPLEEWEQHSGGGLQSADDADGQSLPPAGEQRNGKPRSANSEACNGAVARSLVRDNEGPIMIPAVSGVRKCDVAGPSLDGSAPSITDNEAVLPAPSMAVGIAGATASPSVSIAALRPTDAHVFGREKELARLDDAWSTPTTNVVNVFGFGGAGKSSLVNRWLAEMAGKGFAGAEAVLGWSFDNRDQTAQHHQVAAFVRHALRVFGVESVGSALDDAWRLVKAVRERRSLLILDGVDPFIGVPRAGCVQIAEPATALIVRELAASNAGACIVTSRYAIADIRYYVGTTALEMEISELPPPAGVRLLRGLGVHGSDAQLEEASSRLRGHPLALTLLGTYLRDVCQGEIEKCDRVDLLEQDAASGEPIARIMRFYESCLTPPQLSLLRLVGMLSLPTEPDAVRSLQEAPAIQRLVHSTIACEGADWRRMVAQLRRSRLLFDSSGNPDVIDCHPLVRQYFGRQGVDFLIDEIARDSRALDHREVVALLGRTREPRAVEPLLEALRTSLECRASRKWKSRRPHFISVDYLIPRALGEIGDRRAIPLLIDVLRDERAEASVKMFAASALGRFGDRSAVEPLIELLRAATENIVRDHAAQALGDLRDVRAVAELMVQLEKDRSIYLIEALEKIGDPRPTPVLIEILSDAKSCGTLSCYRVIRALAKFGDESAVLALRSYVENIEDLRGYFVDSNRTEALDAIETIQRRQSDRR